MDTKKEILHQFQTAIVMVNRAGEITFANERFSKKSGYSVTEILRKKIKDFFVNSDFIFHTNQEITHMKTKNGNELPICVEINPIKDAQEYILLLTDVQMSGLDPLTMLPNRYLFTKHLQNAISRARETSSFFAVYFIDLDRFKFINDTLGHAYGDLLLKEAASRLKNFAGEGNMVGRMGGDEFIYLAEDIQHESEVEGRAEALLRLFQIPFQLKEIEIYLSVSIGFSLYPYDGDDMEGLIINADNAMYRAKRNGRCKIEKSRVEVMAGSFEKLMIENDLRTALKNGELYLHYQPQIDWKKNCVSGMEALLRWRHPEFGYIPPDEFIPIAEETGLILTIGEWVLREACSKINEWVGEGYQNVRIAVNLSAKQFLQHDLADKLQKIMAEYRIPRDSLELEITESMMIYDIDSAADILTKLKNLGVHITIDDFGKGHSSLQYLQKLPLDTLKIDRSFIFDIDSNPSSRALSHAISNLASALNMRVIAEGVETERQLHHVQLLNCDVIQGFYYSKPLSPEDAVQFLNTHKGELEQCITFK